MERTLGRSSSAGPADVVVGGTRMRPRTSSARPHGPTRIRRLTVLDRVLRRIQELAARAAGYRIEILLDPKADVMARVHEAIHGRQPPSIPDDLREVEHRYVRGAAVFVARYRGRPVGVLTMFEPRSRSRTTDAMGVKLPDGVGLEQVLDIGQLAVMREHRGGARFAMLSLLAAVQRYTQQVGRTYWVGATSPGLVGVFRSMNPTLAMLEEDSRREFDEASSRYWQIYRGGEQRPLEAFIMEANCASPTAIVTGHALKRLRARMGER